MNAAMPSLRADRQPARVWRLQDAVPGVLHAPGAQHLPREALGRGNARSHREGDGFAFSGGRACVRRPDIDETPLSRDEIWHGLVHRLILEVPSLPQEEIDKHKAKRIPATN